MKLRLVALCLLLASSLAAQEFALTPAELVPSTNAVEPRIAASGDRYFVTWFADNNLYGTRVDAAGNVLNVPLLLARFPETATVIGIGDGDFLVVTCASAGFKAMTTTLGRPMVAALHAGFIAGALNVNEVLNRETLQWTASGGLLQSLAFTPVRDNALPLGALAQSGNNVLAAYTRWDAAAGYVHRVFVRVIATEKPHAVLR